MNLTTSNQTIILEPLKFPTKPSRLYQEVDPTRKGFSLSVSNTPKSPPITLNKFPSPSKKVSFSSRSRKSSLNNTIFTKLNHPSIKFTNLESITLDQVKPPINARKNTKFSNDLSLNPSTNNSYINTTQSPTNSASNSPRVFDKNPNSQKRSEKTRLPARFLSVNERSKYIKTKNLPSFDRKDKDQDLVKSIVENDKIHFRLEVVYRENRQHKLLEKYSILEDNWEWSSYGSASPDKKVRIID